MESPGEIIHGVPRDAALDRILKIGAQNLGILDSLFQLAANLNAPGLWRKRARKGERKHLFVRSFFL